MIAERLRWAEFGTHRHGVRPAAGSCNDGSVSRTPAPWLAAAVVVAVSSSGVETARAGGPGGEGGEGALVIDWRVHVPIVVAGGVGWILSEALLKDGLAEERCDWCGGNGFDDHVRDELRWSRPDAAHRLSDGVGFGLAPLSAFGLTALAAWHDGRAAEWPVDAFVVLEAAVLSADLSQLVKFQTARARPYMRDGLALEPSADSNLSFYSGHTSFAFSLAVASGTVASLRGYRAAPAIWAAGLAAAAATGWLRIAADKHYATDVLTGAAVGAAVGFVVPYFLHRTRRKKSDEQERRPGLELGVLPREGGGLVSIGIRW
jgi:membrane-associated phospholipid phosphatase